MCGRCGQQKLDPNAKKAPTSLFFCFSTDFFGADENVKAEKDEVTITIVFSKNNLLGPWLLGWLNDS